jgi:hypothetical protein
MLLTSRGEKQTWWLWLEMDRNRIGDRGIRPSFAISLSELRRSRGWHDPRIIG